MMIPDARRDLRLGRMISPDRLRALFKAHGVVRSQPDSDWKGSIPLPEPVRAFYRDVGPVDIEIPGYGNPYFFPSLAGLWDLQAGYRWHGDTGDRLSEWDDDWLVVVYEGGDPFILSRRSGKILLAQHGTGTWEPEEILPSIDVLAASLAILGGIVEETGQDLTDDDCVIRPEHRRSALQQLEEVLGSRDEAEELLGVLGWG